MRKHRPRSSSPTTPSRQPPRREVVASPPQAATPPRQPELPSMSPLQKQGLGATAEGTETVADDSHDKVVSSHLASNPIADAIQEVDLVFSEGTAPVPGG